MKQFKRFTAILLSIAILASTLVISGAFSVSAEATVKPDDAPASELLSETKVFTFDNVREFAVNKDYGIDSEGNVFYPVHSASGTTTVKQKNFEVNGETVTTAFGLDSDGDFVNDHGEAIVNGEFQECVLRSAPYFSLRIDGITELNNN
jgi:hypothetical protein